MPEELTAPTLEGLDLGRPETAELLKVLKQQGSPIDPQEVLNRIANENRMLGEKAYEAFVCVGFEGIHLPLALEGNPMVNPETRCPACQAWTWVRPGHEKRCPHDGMPGGQHLTSDPAAEIDAAVAEVMSSDAEETTTAAAEIDAASDPVAEIDAAVAGVLSSDTEKTTIAAPTLEQHAPSAPPSPRPTAPPATQPTPATASPSETTAIAEATPDQERPPAGGPKLGVTASGESSSESVTSSEPEEDPTAIAEATPDAGPASDTTSGERTTSTLSSTPITGEAGPGDADPSEATSDAASHAEPKNSES